MSSEVLLTPASRAPTAAFQFSKDGHGWEAPDSSAHGLGSGGGGGGICCCCALTHLVGACGSCRGISGGSGPAQTARRVALGPVGSSREECPRLKQQ